MAVSAKAWLRAQVVPGGAPCACEDGEQYIEGLLAASRDPRTSDGFSPADLELAVRHIQSHVLEEATNFANSVSKRQAMLESLPHLFHDFVPAFVERSDAVTYFWDGLWMVEEIPELHFAFLDAIGAFLASERPALQSSAIFGLEHCRYEAERTAMLDDFITRADIREEMRAHAISARVVRFGDRPGRDVKGPMGVAPGPQSATDS